MFIFKKRVSNVFVLICCLIISYLHICFDKKSEQIVHIKLQNLYNQLLVSYLRIHFTS